MEFANAKWYKEPIYWENFISFGRFWKKKHPKLRYNVRGFASAQDIIFVCVPIWHVFKLMLSLTGLIEVNNLSRNTFYENDFEYNWFWKGPLQRDWQILNYSWSMAFGSVYAYYIYEYECESECIKPNCKSDFRRWPKALPHICSDTTIRAMLCFMNCVGYVTIDYIAYPIHSCHPLDHGYCYSVSH